MPSRVVSPYLLVQWLSLYSNIGAMYYVWTCLLVTFFTAMLYRQRFEKTLIIIAHKKAVNMTAFFNHKR